MEADIGVIIAQILQKKGGLVDLLEEVARVVREAEVDPRVKRVSCQILVSLIKLLTTLHLRNLHTEEQERP
jgi:hypothetical protein